MRGILRVYVKLFGIFRCHLPCSNRKPSFWLEIEDGAMIETLITLLGISSELPNVIVRNHRIARKQDILQNGDVLAIFPPMDGG